MPGDKRNVRRFNQIDVHIDPTGEATLPANFSADLPTEFVRAGLIDPEGFTTAREEENTDISAYGVDGLVDSIEKFNGESWAVSFLEDNEIVNELLYPGQTGTSIPVPVAKQVVTCFTLTNTSTGYSERWFTPGGSKWRVNGDRTTPDSDIRRTPLICQVFAEDPSTEFPKGRLYEKQTSDDETGGSGSGGGDG